MDLIVPNPTFAGAGDRQHTERVIAAAAEDDVFGDWPFDAPPWALTKRIDTPSSANKSWREKRDAAIAHGDAIEVDASRIRGQRVLLYDDVCTTLLSMEYVARRLKAEGAVAVNGLVLARAEYGNAS